MEEQDKSSSGHPPSAHGHWEWEGLATLQTGALAAALPLLPALQMIENGCLCVICHSDEAFSGLELKL